MSVAKSKGTKKSSATREKSVSPINIEQSRMNIRLALSIKERIARAALLSGQDLTEFAITALSEKADTVIERYDHLLLGSEEHEFFLNALSEKAVQEPSERSLSAAERYRRGKRKGVRYNLAD